MTKPSLAVLIATLTCVGALAAVANPASAGPRTHTYHRGWMTHPRLHVNRSYRRRLRYYRANACGYGDCACIRSYALATGSQVWWDRYQACSGR